MADFIDEGGGTVRRFAVYIFTFSLLEHLLKSLYLKIKYFRFGKTNKSYGIFHVFATSMCNKDHKQVYLAKYDIQLRHSLIEGELLPL